MNTLSFGTAFTVSASPRPLFGADEPKKMKKLRTTSETATPTEAGGPKKAEDAKDQFEKKGEKKAAKAEKPKTSIMGGLWGAVKWGGCSSLVALLLGLPLTIIGLPLGGIPATPGIILLLAPLVLTPLGYFRGRKAD